MKISLILDSHHLTQTLPTKQNDSEYPPSLFIKNTSKFLPRYSSTQINGLPGLARPGSSYYLKTPQNSTLAILTILWNYELFFPNPFRIVEGYTYNGNDSVKSTEILL